MRVHHAAQKSIASNAAVPSRFSQFSHPFTVPQEAAEPLDLETQYRNAERLGHRFEDVRVGRETPGVGDPAQAVAPPSPGAPIQFVRGKEQRQKAKEFNQKKKEYLENQRQQEKQQQQKMGKKEKKKAVTEAFDSKHVTRNKSSLNSTSDKVANTRKWGGGGTSGRSTVVAMTPEDQEKERLIAINNLKMNEGSFDGEDVNVNMGVNKPTFFDYPLQSASVSSDNQGKRTVEKEKEELAKPVLGLKGGLIHHLHGVEKEDEG